MKKLMEYKIISGRTVEIRRSFLPCRKAGEERPVRAPRKAGSSSEKKIKANETSSVRQLARGINSTMEAGDIFATLKYDSEHLPATEEEAIQLMVKFLRKLKAEFRKQYGRNPQHFWVDANWSPKRNAPARLHHHLVIEREAEGMLSRLWQGGGLILVYLDNRGDHSDLAAYMVGNVHGRPGKKKWHASRNVERPIYTEPIEVDDVEGVQAEPGSVIKDCEESKDEDERVISKYIRCLLPEAPKVRGGQIILPRRRRRVANERS